MKEIHNIEIEGGKYAVGLDWEEISFSKNSSLNSEIKALSKKKNKQYGCKNTHGIRKQVGFSKVTSKGLIAAGCIVSRALEDTLYIKKLDNVDYWVCYVDSEKLVAKGREGIFNEENLVEIIDELILIGDIKITCTEEDRDALFGSTELEAVTFEYKSFKEILQSTKKNSDDVIGILYRDSNYIKIGGVALSVMVLAGGAYYYLFSENPLYEEIINQELSAPLDGKEAEFKKAVSQAANSFAGKMSLNSGKKMLIEKIETNIYSKSEIFSHIKEMSEVFPVYFFEWQLDSIQFIKSDNNKDIKFSATYKRIKDSIGYYEQINKELIPIIQQKLHPLNINTYPGDLDNNVMIMDVYFKQPAQVEDQKSEEEVQQEIKKQTEETNKKVQKIREQISQIEFEVSQSGFFERRFSSLIDDSAESIESLVNQGGKLYQDLLKTYEKQSNEVINVPESYYSGSKKGFLNLMQQNSYYEWKDDKKALTLPPTPTNQDQLKSFVPFTKVWTFSLGTKDFSTEGVDSIKNAVDILDKPAIGIYTVNYKIENETWDIKGELYEKN